MESRTKKLSGLLNDAKIVEKGKLWLIIPSAIIGVAIIFGIIWGVVFGSPLKLSMDFAGGYSMELKLGARLNDATYPEFESRINEIASGLKDEHGEAYGLTVSEMYRQGSSDPSNASIMIRYQAPRNRAEDESALMEEINEKFEAELNKLVMYLPTVTIESGKITAVYANALLPSYESVIRAQAETENIEVTGVTFFGDNKQVIVTHNSGTVGEEQAVKFLTIPDTYAGKAVPAGLTGPTVSNENLVYAILAIAMALTLMLVYIMFRFEVSSGMSALMALVHDILIMFAFMVIFHIEIGSTFIAALITILGYSINNTIVLFDRVREKTKPFAGGAYDPLRVANDSVRSTFKRSLFTTITTLIPIVMLAIIGAPSIRIFAFPIIIGLIAGTFSSVCIAPTLWGLWKQRL